MDKELKRKLQLIEDRIVRINDRESRKIQFQLNTYSMILGAIIALSIALVVEFIKSILPTKFSTFIGLTIYACLLIGIIFWARTKELMDIGDFEFTGNLNVKKHKDIFIKEVEQIVSTKNKSLKEKLRPSFKGFNVTKYWYNTFRCVYKDKLEYILKNTDKLDAILINYSSDSNSKSSQIFLDFKNEQFVVSLDDQHFSTNDALKIVNELKKLKYDFFTMNKSKIRGF